MRLAAFAVVIMEPGEAADGRRHCAIDPPIKSAGDENGMSASKGKTL